MELNNLTQESVNIIQIYYSLNAYVNIYDIYFEINYRNGLIYILIHEI